MFPSNIAGLPTWFTIRASKQGYVGRRKEVDFLVAMNPETAREDVMQLAGGAAVVYDAPLNSTSCAAISTSIPCRSINSWRRVVPRPGCASWSAT